MERIAKKSWEESKTTWRIAGPVILTAVLQCTVGFVTVAFAGHLGKLELAAVSIAQGVVEGFGYGILVYVLCVKQRLISLVRNLYFSVQLVK